MNARTPGRAVVVVSALVAATLLVNGATAAVAPQGDDGPGIDPDRKYVRVELHANGSATWTVEYAYSLESANRSAAFDDLRADVRANRSAYVGTFRRTVGSSVARAENATGREMAMRDVSVRARRQQVAGDVGLVTYRFRWTNFSRTDGRWLVAGDAVDGMFVDGKTRLEFTWPAGYELRSATPPDPDEREPTAVAWEGPTNFAREEPRLRLRRQPNATTTPASTDAGPEDGPVTAATGTPTPGSDDRDGSLGLSAVALAGATVVVLGSLGWTATRIAGSTGGSGPDEEVPAELLSNEERVLRVLDEHGGRTKQKTLREELGWAAPKTSKVLGELREAGEVEVFRLGRENVVTLPGVGLEEDDDA